MPLHGKEIVLGVTGGIAAYKAAELVSRLKKKHANVSVIMTHNATEFVTPLTFETLSVKPVVTDTFVRPEKWDVAHVSLAKRAALFVVAPATANVMAKMAHGIADDMLSTTLLATKAPILLAPAMNTNMWTNPATQENLKVLQGWGIKTVGPGNGLLACGDSGDGRMAEPEIIVNQIEDMLAVPKDMAGLRVTVTAGPTCERIDPVRYLTNDSSGKMGYAIAQEAMSRGASVTLVSGKVNLTPPYGVQIISITSTQDLLDTLVEQAPKCDILIQAAAPADFTFKAARVQKLKKQGNEPLTLTFEQTPDVAKTVGINKRSDQVFIGFAAETESLIENAKRKLNKKNLDMVVANDVTQKGAGFGGDTNIASLITPSSIIERPLQSKRALAKEIVNKAVEILNQKRQSE